MTAFEQYLQDNGYRPHKAILVGKKGKKEIVYEPISIKECGFFSTMCEGRLDNVWIKGDTQIIFGLSEKGKPPTLIRPRPVGVNSDDEMNRILKKGDFKTLVFDLENAK